MYLTDDFKPASVDTTRPAELVVGDTNEITVTMPHVQVLYCTKLKLSLFISLILFLWEILKHAALDQSSFEVIREPEVWIQLP